MAKTVSLIVTHSTAGTGTGSDDVFREVTELWTLDGQLVCRYDGYTRHGVVTPAIVGLDR